MQKYKVILISRFRTFLQLSFISKLTEVAKTNANFTNYNLTNDFVNAKSSTGIIKSDLSDYFLIFLLTSEQMFDSSKNKVTI